MAQEKRLVLLSLGEFSSLVCALISELRLTFGTRRRWCPRPSSVMIIEDIMRGINEGRQVHEHLRPWQVFDLIGGTSTGG